MRLIANRQLCGVYGVVVAGQEFDCPDEIAVTLLKAELVRKPAAPQVVYETKVVMPGAPGVSTRPLFCDVSVPDAQQARVFTPSDSVLPESDVPTPRTTNSRGRAGRARSGPK